MEASGAAANTYIDITGCHLAERLSKDCGYCDGSKGFKGHKSWGITSPKMTVGDYQKLMDRGWRRCGTYYYKWDLASSCC
jgi:arginine-tRNA-protein transferase